MLLPAMPLWASHIVGGEVYYKFIGSTAMGNEYQISITIYQDCLNGQASAIEEDNPAYIAIYDNAFPNPRIVDSLRWTIALSVPANFDNACVKDKPPVCLNQKTFIRNYILPRNATGYTVSYQRCCRNGQIMNIFQPGDNGATFFCVIPPVSTVPNNNSAVFKNYPPQIICLNNPIYYDHSATDIDPRDSLSYEFCESYIGGSPSDIKPLPPKAPPYSAVSWIAPFSFRVPITGAPPIQINPRTGLITGTPNRLGRYLFTVCCNEWRNGVLINTVKREFQFVVTDCSRAVVACIPQYSTDINTYIIECKDFKVHFVNCSSGGFAYNWDFGVPGITTDVSNEFEPNFTYPDTGTYVVTLIVNPGTTCPDSITRFVKIYPKFKTNFGFEGPFCPNEALLFTDSSSSTIKPIVLWQWNFGDGNLADSQNKVHTYTAGGIYNVKLISKNDRNCIDSAVKQVAIDNFQPIAGRDTIIVKEESIQFNANGGRQFRWYPGTYLNDTTIGNPLGYFPDTGVLKYTLKVTSNTGCTGYDTMRVMVIDKPYFYMPNAFTPNGDGNNDVFRPITVGFKSIAYFSIYNRFGERVYTSENLTDGWDGTYKGTKAELGVYFWHLSYVDRANNSGTLKGDVTLIR